MPWFITAIDDFSCGSNDIGLGGFFWVGLRCVALLIQDWDLERRDGAGEHWFAWF